MNFLHSTNSHVHHQERTQEKINEIYKQIISECMSPKVFWKKNVLLKKKPFKNPQKTDSKEIPLWLIFSS